MIKYRSWNDEYNGFIYFENGTYFTIERTGGLDIRNYSFNSSQLIYNFDWNEAEQSTGILDCNYEEIYIGDILYFKDFGCYRVKFNEFYCDNSNNEYSSVPVVGFYLEAVENSENFSLNLQPLSENSLKYSIGKIVSNRDYEEMKQDVEAYNFWL